MNTAKQILDDLGRERVAARLGVGKHSIAKAIQKDQFPASWFMEMRDMAQESGVHIPDGKFKWRGSS